MTKQTDEIFAITKIIPSVDWISGTVREDGRRDDLAVIAHKYLNSQLDLGHQADVWKSYRYEGWRINGASWGRRQDDDIITFSGSVAHGNWKEISTLLETCSRLDLAVTVWYRNHKITLAGETYQKIQEIAKNEVVNRKYTYMTNLLGGDTLYVGSRNSQYFGRLYDKCLQSKDIYYANSWRWEVEYHKPASLEMVHKMAEAENLNDFILLHVRNWFSDRFVDCPFSPSVELIAVEAPRRQPTKDEQTLEWLENGVAKSVQKLAKRGKVKQVLKALGLEGYADEVFRKEENKRKK